MTKKSFVLDTPFLAQEKPQSLFARLAATRPVVALAAFYSRLLEEPVSPRHTLHLLNAQAAVLAAIFPADMSLFLRGLFFLWAALALLGCRQRAKE